MNAMTSAADSAPRSRRPELAEVPAPGDLDRRDASFCEFFETETKA
jgi:hypothetical protein